MAAAGKRIRANARQKMAARRKYRRHGHLKWRRRRKNGVDSSAGVSGDIAASNEQHLAARHRKLRHVASWRRRKNSIGITRASAA
jgi:hypothetical protein